MLASREKDRDGVIYDSFSFGGGISKVLFAFINVTASRFWRLGVLPFSIISPLRGFGGWIFLRLV